MATSFSGGGSRSTRREPPTLGKQLVNFITFGCESSAPFLLFTKLGSNPRRIGDKLVWVVRSNDLTHWATWAPILFWILYIKHIYRIYLVDDCLSFCPFSYYLWQLYCLSFELWLLITHFGICNFFHIGYAYKFYIM